MSSPDLVKRLKAVARAAIKLLEENGPCDNYGEDYDDYEDPHCDDADCAYCNLDAAASAISNSEVEDRGVQK